MKDLVAGGQIVPFQLTVSLLVKALIENPAKNYLIDGFPRALDQAIYFEQNVCECQTILNYEVSEEILVERLLKRAETSGRTDDTPECIKERIRVFNESTQPVIDFYNKFGKVRHIDATGEINEIYNITKKSLLPELFCMIGPPTCGKTSVCQELVQKGNLKYIDFLEWKKSLKPQPPTEELLIREFISMIECEISPRILLESFPENEFQARYFVKNCKKPDLIMNIKCSSDICQERNLMNSVKRASSVLSTGIKEFHKRSQKFMKIVEKAGCLVSIDSSNISLQKTVEKAMEPLTPQILIVKADLENKDEMETEIAEDMEKNHGFIWLKLGKVLAEEEERRTGLGLMLSDISIRGQVVTPEVISMLIRNCVFSGSRHTKYVLTGFPELLQQAELFEGKICKLWKELYIYESSIIAPGGLNNTSVETYFYKSNRLIATQEYSWESLQTSLGPKLNYFIAFGSPYCGTNEISKEVAGKYGFTLIEWGAIEEIVKKKLSTEEEEAASAPYEEQLKEVSRIMIGRKDPKEQFLVDNLPFEKDQVEMFLAEIGPPMKIFDLFVEKEVVRKKYMIQESIEEIGEEVAEEIEKVGTNIYIYI